MDIDVEKEIERINQALQNKTSELRQLENMRQQLINEALQLQGVLNYLVKVKEGKEDARENMADSKE